MWNRYFTPLREAKGMQAIPFLPGVDPSDILYNMAHEDNNYRYIHSEDNQVQYFTSHRDDKGIIRYVILNISQRSVVASTTFSDMSDASRICSGQVT
jgi:hypothetical protein